MRSRDALPSALQGAERCIYIYILQIINIIIRLLSSYKKQRTDDIITLQSNKPQTVNHEYITITKEYFSSARIWS